jgi:hypothetical protein
MSALVRDTMSTMGGALMASSKAEAFKRGHYAMREVAPSNSPGVGDGARAESGSAFRGDAPVMTFGGTRLRLAGTRTAPALSMQDLRFAGLGNDGEADQATYTRDDDEPVFFTFLPGRERELGTWLVWLPEEEVAVGSPESTGPGGILRFLPHSGTEAPFSPA